MSVDVPEIVDMEFPETALAMPEGDLYLGDY
jgi:hypothetical protein